MNKVAGITDGEKLNLLLSEITNMKSNIDKIDSIENDIKSIKLTVENEIRVNIQRVAEVFFFKHNKIK